MLSDNKIAYYFKLIRLFFPRGIFLMNSGLIFRNNLACLLLISLFSIASSQESISFTLPEQGSLISTPVCTLLVESDTRIRRVEFQARYMNVQDSAVIINLGTVSKAPFQTVWDISDIPNQLISGVSLLAIAIMGNWKEEETKREGVFFVHQPIKRPLKTIHYDHKGTKKIKSDTISFKYARSPGTVTSSLYWNENDITVLLEVKDPLFYANVTREELAGMGMEIMLDPSMGRKPYPDKNILSYAVPLYGKPYRIIYNPQFDSSGSFKLITSTELCDFKHHVTKEDFKGFKIYFSIPLEKIATPLPEEIGCNLVVKTLVDNNIVRSPWINHGPVASYSPFVWGSIKFHPKPFYKNRLLIGGISFGSGFLLTLLIQLLIFSLRKTGTGGTTKRSEAEEKAFERIKEAMEKRITQKNAAKEDIAKDLKISVKKLNKLIKSFTGLSFQNYLMYNRTEIAKERLRSSHCNEATVAEACGFQNAQEMEKYFQKFHRTTPGKFRSEQQVA